MNRSFYNGVSGIKTHQFGLDVWANNIANINTNGYKYKIPEFSTIFTQSLQNQNVLPVANDIGLGSIKEASAPVMTMGSLIATNNEFDMAIGGKGWFGIQDMSGDYFYTRNGSFSRDADGYLVDTNGNYVMGKSANNISDGILTNDKIGDIKLNNVSDGGKINLPEKLVLPAKPTTFVKMKGNLDSTIKYKIDENGQKVEEANKDAYRTILYKKDGGKNFLDIIFTKEVPQAPTGVKWNAKATVKDENGNILTSKDGEFLFDDTGAFISTTLTSINSDGMDIKWDFGTPLNSQDAFSGRDGLTSYRGKVEGKSITKDGYPQGSLNNYGIDELGNIQAIFDNGRSVPVYKIMVFNFINEQGLEQISSTYFKQSPNSGNVQLLKSKDGDVIQSIKNRHLETSNMSLQTAMTELIVMQKAFDASSKSITTSDQLIQNAINMKK